jgi:ligand-binding sensor domain-containing protein
MKQTLQNTLYVLFLYFLTVFNAYCQQKNILFEKYDVECGLNTNHIRDLTQDQLGYIWIATVDGLNRFDGYSMKSFRHNKENTKSLKENYINSIFIDSENLLWICYKGGISRYEPDKEEFSHYVHNPNDITSISSNKVSDATCDSKGNLWIATGDNGLCHLDKSTYHFQSFKHPENTPKNSQYTVLCDKKDRLWIGTYNAGISLFDTKTKKYHSFGEKGSGIEDCFIMSIFEDNKGIVWVGTSGFGLFYFDEKEQRFLCKNSIPTAYAIVSISQDLKGNIWASGENNGLYIFNETSAQLTRVVHNKYISNGLSHNSVNSMKRDKDGNIWLGTFANGINLYKAQNNRFGHIFNDPMNTNSLCHNAILSFTEDKDKNLWIGTDDGGLNKYDQTTNTFTWFSKTSTTNPSKSNIFLSLYADAQDKIWMGTYLDGLQVYDKKTKIFTQKVSNTSFGSIVEDKQSNLWLGSWGKGLYKYNKGTNTFVTFTHKADDNTSLSDDFVLYVYMDKRGILWVCTTEGLNRLDDPETGKFRRFMNDPGNPNSLGNNFISHCYEDSKGRFWIGTAGGLSLMNRDSIKFITYSEKHGIANESVSGILEDNAGNLWLSTNKGLTCFNPDTKTFKNYDKSDGLQSNQFSVKAQYKLSSGELLFGGINGYNRFLPSEITTNKNIPMLVIKDFKAIDKTQKNQNNIDLTWPREGITVSNKQSNLVFDFVAFNYTNTKKVKYAYILEGYDDEWKYTNNPTPVNYTNLDPGNYIFKIKAANEDGLWNDTGASLSVTIEPSIWSSWWIKTLLVMSFLYVLYFIYKKKYAVVVKTQKQLENIVKEKSDEIRRQKEKIEALSMKLTNND